MKRKILALLLSAIMLCGLVGCDRNEGDSFTHETSSNKSQSMSTNEATFNFDEAVKNILLFGHKISLPCTIADFGKDFSLNDRVTPIPESDAAVCQLFYNGKIVGGVTLADWKSGENQTKKSITGFRIGFGDKKRYNDDSMRTQYYDSLNRYSGRLDMSIAGITYSSSSADIISILGEPTQKEIQGDGTEELFYQYSDEKRYIRVIFHNGSMVDFYFNIG